MSHFRLSACAASAVLLAGLGITGAATAQKDHPSAIARMSNSEGRSVGIVRLIEPEGGQGVIVDAMLEKLPEGTHAIHIHETGACSPPGFTSAGGHFNPTGRQHGIENPEGMHAGDLPNIHVPASGELRVEMFSTLLSLDDALFDADRASVVIHANADDYATDPAGDAGPRIACGVITRE